jgi:hypothetical protein
MSESPGALVMPLPNDYPLHECVAQAEALVRSGAIVHQKFTCASCGARQTIETPNTFHTRGRCEECNAITEIERCNYLVFLQAGGTR